MTVTSAEKRDKAFEKELKYIRKLERELQRDAMKGDLPWKKALESKIPPKIHSNLRAAFIAAFGVIFDSGVTVIEKTFNKEELMQEYAVRNVSVDISTTRKELAELRNEAARSDAFKSIVTTLEGVGLGAFGIGLPDIVFFIGYMLKSIYETALKYGYDYDKPEERYLILKLMAASIKKREDWVEADIEVNELIENLVIPEEEEMTKQIEATADAFAIDMLLMKFIQGIPIVGIVGGLSNPYYFMKIMEYVRIKYHKRYLLEKK
ncbi:MAG: EcsC family protein [Firmicutes bacterium]|nr:EcsC family protein [Bacillota bacterium]